MPTVEVSEEISPPSSRRSETRDVDRASQLGHRETPIFILAPHRSCTSLACAMLGQHPGLVDVPETNLATARTLWEWWTMHGRGRGLDAEGLVRAVAEFWFGEQTERGVRAARWWIRRHIALPTDHMWSLLDSWVHPLGMVEKSPAIVYEEHCLQRLIDRWPSARYVHLVRHPVSYSLSMLDMPVACQWMARLGAVDNSGRETSLDPPRLWHRAHTNILGALTRIPADRQARIRAEELLSEPHRALSSVSQQLGLPVDAEISAAMMRPERSPFAHIGPPGGRFGNDPSFLRQPRLRNARRSAPPSLEGALPWRRDGRRLDSEVVQLGHHLGYA